MKNLTNSKKVVLTVGSLGVVSGIIGLLNASTFMEQFFPIYAGLTLIGTVLLHKEEEFEVAR